MTPLYIIPARGGSKGIPRKNIKPLGGKPLIAYSIEVARGAGAPDTHIILSTDDPEIADTGRACGLPVEYMRPPDLATDVAGSREVVLHAMDWADARNIGYDCVVLLQPTSPFRTAEDITAALSLFSDDIDMVVSVVESNANPYYNLFEIDPHSGMLDVSKGDGLITRRQDAPKVWAYNGAVYVINPSSLRLMPFGLFRRRIPYPMPPERSIDIDTPADWLLAEALIAGGKI